ncbi:MAG: hypothetical protein INR69_03065 [Mucilaginibacter polytrichastri]|nr:hypothetical protein [Mucilaginibacter polytrichastri]
MSLRKPTAVFTCIFFLLVCGCSLQKETRLNTGLQNLTARYNIIFNAKALLKERRLDLATGFVDGYDDFLRIFPDTGGCSDASIADSVIRKCRTVIADKSRSNYVGQAYLLMGQASYYKCDYYNATEYFDYVYRNWPRETELVVEARSWKARSWMMSDRQREAGLLLDTAISMNDTLKHPSALPYATKVLWAVDEGDFVLAESMAAKAIAAGMEREEEWRTRFLLAQLQEVNKKPQDAFDNYTRIQRSNAPFEMAFNASLNKIRIVDEGGGQKMDRVEAMLQLLRDDKNREFQDQIYYQIAQLRLAEKKYDEAEKYYKLAIDKSTKNLQQKGLAYLRLAELSITPRNDYGAAKNYYDDALSNLPKTYPGYAQISKKAQNLSYIAGKLDIISKEDTLQMLAKLPEKERAAKITEMVDRQTKKEQIQSGGMFTGIADTSAGPRIQTQVTTTGAFYFDNANAVSQGFSAFKRRWGDRKLADNWRSSARGQAELVPTASIPSDPDDPSTASLPPGATPNSQSSAPPMMDAYTPNVPVSPELLQASNDRIITAYVDLANYYRDELEDKQEAINTYQTLLRRFPDYEDRPFAYYNLYRLYQEKDAVKSAAYRDTLVKLFPESTYAQSIVDPDYFSKMSEANAGMISAYENIYKAYASRDYKATISQSDNFTHSMPGTPFTSQAAYLKAIAIGHQQKLPGFEQALKDVVAQYPSDKLVVPLIRQHLAYIDSNRAALARRPVALMDHDPNEPPFIEPQEPVSPRKTEQAARPAVKKPETPQVAQAPQAKPAEQPAVQPEKSGVKTAEVEVNNTPFTLTQGDNYYFVVNVASGSANLSSSRFGIGQFNRANFQGGNIRHQLKNIGSSNQLIYVGRFFSLDAVKEYARNIVPLMPEIMKVPKEQYSFFIISQENLDKLADTNLLQQYVGFYEKNF